MRLVKILAAGSVAAGLALSIATTAAASGAPKPEPTASQRPGAAETFVGNHTKSAAGIVGCAFKAQQPDWLVKGGRLISGKSWISACTTPAPVWCRLQSRLQMWVPYSGQWVQKGKWKDSGWKGCNVGRTFEPSYKCPRHSTAHEFITDSWLAIITPKGNHATNYVDSPSKKLTCS